MRRRPFPPSVASRRSSSSATSSGVWMRSSTFGRVIRAMRAAMPAGTSGRNRRTSGIASPFIARATIASASSPS